MTGFSDLRVGRRRPVDDRLAGELPTGEVRQPPAAELSRNRAAASMTARPPSTVAREAVVWPQSRS